MGSDMYALFSVTLAAKQVGPVGSMKQLARIQYYDHWSVSNGLYEGV